MKKIALDAGHGLYTPGKQTPTGIKEWTLNDKIRDKVVAILADYEVSIINVDNNEGKVDEPLNERVARYIKAGVDAVVSIHHNAFTGNWNGATGVEVWVDRNATSADLKLAELIYDRMVKYTGLAGRGIKREDWTVIHQNSIPAVLCEGGFMDSSKDYNIITSDAGQTAYAKAVAEGLIEFLDLKKKVVEAPKSNIIYRVQTGAYTNIKNANAQLARVKAAGFDTYMVRSGKYYKIQVGAYSVKENAEKMAKKLEDAGFTTYITTQGETSASTKKSIDEIAREVICGDWGNGADRTNRLSKAGYSMSEIRAIQDRVNELL